MTNNVKPVPEGYHTVNAYLQIEGVPKQIEFLEKAFGGQCIHRSNTPDGGVVHAEVRIGDSVVMMGEVREPWKPRPATVYVYVEDVDALYKNAIAAGAKSLAEPANQFYGDRSGGVEDPCGNFWWIATHMEDVSSEEINRRFAAMGGKH